MTKKAKIAVLAGIALFAAPLLALAQNISASGSAGIAASSSGISAGAHASTTARAQNQQNKGEKLNARLADAKDRADQEITRRIDTLNQLKARVAGMKRIGATDQTELQASLAAQISAMNTLSAQIEADDATSSLKSDIQSITASYRIYALVVPQAAIIAAADRVLGIVVTMQDLSTKLHARVDGAGSAALTSTLSEYDTKVADARIQANAAVSEVSSLKPDNGDDTVKASNAAALRDARAKIQIAQQDLTVARQDAGTIVKGLPKGSASTNASSTAQYQ